MNSDLFKPVYENNNIISLVSDAFSVTLEPGGQVELSGPVFANINEIYQECSHFDALLKKYGESFGALAISQGFHSSVKGADFNLMPEACYKIIRKLMPQTGALGLDIMLRTCFVQANLGYENKVDMLSALKTALVISPIITALFAASPFKEGKQARYLSTRAHA